MATDSKVFLTQGDAEKIETGLAAVRDIKDALPSQISPPRDHLNWQLVKFVCDVKVGDYYPGKVMLGEGKELGDCHIRASEKMVDLNRYYAALMVEVIDNTPVFFVPASGSLGSFKLLQDLYKCSSAQAEQVYYDEETGARCATERTCNAGSGSGSGPEASPTTTEVTIVDTIGLRAPPRKSLGPGMLALKDDIVWAEFKGDSGLWEAVALGQNCCALPYGSGSGSGSGGCCEAEVLEDIDDDVLDHVDVDVVSTCVDGEIHNEVTVTETRKKLNKTKKTIQFACCEE
jgi:hypothetical protein